MNRKHKRIFLFIAICSASAGCMGDNDKEKAETSNRVQPERMNPGSMAVHGAREMAGRSEEKMPGYDGHSCFACDTGEIGRRADDLPPPLGRQGSQLVTVDLYTDEVVAEMMPGVTYQYWTYNGKVPGPFIRAKEGDLVEIRLSHGKPGAAHREHAAHASEEHAAAGHSSHSIDLHAVIGPGGGAPLMQVAQGEEKRFRFKADHPGIYVYHCASPHVPTHIANGMYGMILVEPAKGLGKAEREFYIMQGDFYTAGKFGDRGFQAFSREKMLAEKPDYFLFNGRVGSLSGDRALKAKVGEKIRMFVGVGSHVAAHFHIIGVIFENLYSDGAILSAPLKNVQTASIAPGSAVMIEFTAKVPGKYQLIDHSLTRSFDKGALAELVIEGPEQPELYRPAGP